MPIPEKIKPLYAQDRVERAENEFANKASVTALDVYHVMIVSQVEAGIDKYRGGADDMTPRQLRDEDHQSQRLATHLEEGGDFKPHDKCHAHAIVSGAHRNAAPMRAIMARQKIRIDDPYNGCWLPANTASIPFMPSRLKNAVPHSRIHRYNYYFWLNTQISLTRTPTPDDLKYTLKTIGLQLQAGAQPPFVMLKKGGN